MSRVVVNYMSLNV